MTYMDFVPPHLDNLTDEVMSHMAIVGCEAVHLQTTVSRAYILATYLQLALRHPLADGPSAPIAQEMLTHLIDGIRDIDSLLADSLVAGFDPSNDFVRFEVNDDG